MKFLALVPLAALALLTPSVQASNVDPVFIPEQGILVLPNLKLANDPHTYTVVLHRVGTTWSFVVDTDSITALSPDSLGYTTPTPAELVGTWTTPNEPGAYYTLHADGTYTLNAAPDSDCPNGGLESGTYQYEPITGVFSPVANAANDHNGKCGWSVPNQINILKKIGTDMYFYYRDKGQEYLIKVIKQS